MQPVKIIIEKHADGYVAYPLGWRGVIVGEGDSYEEALSDVKSAIRFHLETFDPDAFDTNSPVLEVFVDEYMLDLAPDDARAFVENLVKPLESPEKEAPHLYEAIERNNL